MTSSPFPGLLLILGSVVIPFLQGRARNVYMALLILGSWLFLHQTLLSSGMDTTWTLEVLGYTLTPVRLDPLSMLFGGLFHLALFIGLIFAAHVKDATQHVSAFVYGGSAIGAAFAGDLVTLFIYWEIVGVSSVFLIWARRTDASYAAGMRYLIWQIVSGVLLLAGVLVFVSQGRSLEFTAIDLPAVESLSALPAAIKAHPGGWLIFLAVGIKCCFPGLHTWLTDAYPEATPTGAVFLSAFTTKLAVYALIRGFPGTDVLIPIGAVMALFPIFYAVIENDLRRVLAYSMINQVGFMVIGVGIGTDLALSGAALHAFADVLFKGLLFMSMGAVLHRTGTVAASELGGLFKSMPLTTLFCLFGAASISAFPLFSAFATKSIIMDEVGRLGLSTVWFIMVFASAGVLHHAGIKIPYCAFFAHDSGRRPREAPKNMLVAMGITSFLCVAIGCGGFMLLYGVLPDMPEYHPYKLAHVVTQLQLLLFAILAFVLLTFNGFHPDEVPGTNLDADWLWRHLLRKLWRGALVPLSLLARGFQALVLDGIPGMLKAVVSDDPERGPARDTLILGSSILVVMILLGFYLAVGHTAKT